MFLPSPFHARAAGAFLLANFVALAPMTLSAAPVPVSVLLQINRVAGSPSGVAGGPVDGGPALFSFLYQPTGVAVDGAGNLYIADTANNQIERIDAASGNITTLAANGLLGSSGTALLNQPACVLVDPHGNLYIADTGNHLVRFFRMDTGVITTVAGNPANTPFEPGNIGDGGPATLAALDSPTAVALDGNGNLYVADAGDSRVREISATSGIISTVAGTGVAGYTSDGGPATTTELNHPTGIAVDLAGNLYISDSGNNLIREVNHSSGIITTIAGVVGSSGGYNGDHIAATQSMLNFPDGIAVDLTGQVYFSDRANNRIRKIRKDGVILTLAGNGAAGFFGDGNLAALAEINSPAGVALDHEGNLYIADSGNNALRVISKELTFPAAEIGSNSLSTHTIFIETNEATSLSSPMIPAAQTQPDSAAKTPLQEFSIGNIVGCTADGTTVNAAGSICAVPISFTPQYPGLRNGAMHLTASGASISLGFVGVGLAPQAVLAPGMIQTALNSADTSGGFALMAPQRIAVDPAGNVYLADAASNVIWRWQNRAGAIPTVIAGGGTLAPAQANGGSATNATMEQPSAVALDAAGNLYIAETGANLVRKVSLPNGIISTGAGTGSAGYSGDRGAATSATLNAPAGVASNKAGDIFIADTGNNVIRRVYASSGIIVTVAGTGTSGYSGDGGDAVRAQLNHPQSVALDSTGGLFIADTGNNVIRTVDPVRQTIATIAGNGTAGFGGDGGQAANAQLRHPSDIALDAAGNLYIADSGNARVRKLNSQSGVLVTFAGSAIVGDDDDGGPASAAALTTPTGVAVDSLGQLWVSDPGNITLRSVSYIVPTLNFGSQTLGAITAGQSDSLSNIGNQSLVIDQYPAPPAPADFILSPDANKCSVGNLAAGNQCDISYAFEPTAVGVLTENAWILDNSLNATGAKQAVTMTGNGISYSSLPTAIGVVVEPSTAVYGTPMRVIANVSDATGPVTIGTVVFAVNGNQVATVAMSGSGAGKTQLPATPTGSNMVTATYEPAGNELGSNGATTFMVTPASSQTLLAISATNLRVGQNVTVTATVVSSTIGVPTGTVRFMSGDRQLGVGALDTNGKAVLKTQQLLPGTNVLTVSYPGDHNFQPSNSASVTVMVANESLIMTIHPDQLNIPAGKTGQTTVILIPLNAFSDTITLDCIGLVRGATCKFTTPAVTFSSQSSAPLSNVLVIDPHTLTVAGIRMPAKTIPILRLTLLVLGLGAMLLPFLSRRRAATFGWGRILLVLVCVGLGSVLGCANLAPPSAISDEITVQAATATQGVLASAHLQVNMAQ
ncbi:MAG: Ig-like domain repeat protein [Acidobacteriaceae bacterium]